MADVSLPDPETIRRTAQEVVSRPDYHLDPERLDVDFLAAIWRFVEWLLSPLRALFGILYGVSPALAVLVGAGLLAIVVLLSWHMIYTLRHAMQARVREGVYAAHARAVADPAEFERLAESALAKRDYIGAIRYLFRASLVRLQQSEKRPLRAGATNRDLLRKYRESPLFESLNLFVETIDAKWYGRELCLVEDYSRCLGAHERLRQLIVQRATPGAPR